jgi:prepilin-type N-terminal cleavage/methylation domain-containing protein
MAKKLQQLKNKKGFTLVELLVVIAIIGILAAILIPLMTNYTRQARITGANSTASSTQSIISHILQEEFAADRGPKDEQNVDIELRFGNVQGLIESIDVNASTWDEEFLPAFYEDETINQDIDRFFKLILENKFPNARSTAIAISIRSGKVLSVVVVPGGSTSGEASQHIDEDGLIIDVRDGRRVNDAGNLTNQVVGTYPVAETT